ncbi:MAG: hypothetical protein FVQ79_04910 [Planctomycetes bacterium]|nr:hypothetical protein [Planctomycetota bacterium]
MNKSMIIIICFIVLTSATFAETTDAVWQPKYPGSILREGFVFNGINGTVRKAGNGDTWVFTPDVDVTDTSVFLRKTESIELLPSSTLEKIVFEAEQNQKNHTAVSLRMWGTVTTYSKRGTIRKKIDDSESTIELPPYRNFLFPAYFIPMAEIETRVDSEKEKQLQQEENQIKESIIPVGAREKLKSDEPKKVIDEDAVIPADIMAKLKPKRRVNLDKWRKTLQVEGDFLLVGRSGFVKLESGQSIFALDALGRKIDGLSFRLLPCQALQNTQERIANSFGRQRYKVAGTVTKYKGENYMLLQHAVRTYTNGNFAR